MSESRRLLAVRAGFALKAVIFVSAVGVGGLAIALARHYKRPEPTPRAVAPGMTVSPTSITLTSDAPMWSTLKIGAAEPPEAHWSEPIPGRVVFDETRASRLGCPLQGRVTAVMVVRGQHVDAGTPVYSVLSPHLAELRAELAKSTVVQSATRASFERLQSLANEGVSPRKEYLAAKQAMDEANLAVELAKQKLSSLRVGPEGDATFTVTAPRDGVVVELNLAVGQEIDATTGTVVAIADLSMVWVVADLFEDEVGELTPGLKAKVTVGTAEFEGTIDLVSSIVDNERHTVPVRVKLANADGHLRPNAYAQIRFFDPIAAKATVPASAVMSDGAHSYVYMKEGHVLKRRTVVTGPASEGRVPVLDGLEPGDQVVKQGAILLDNQIQIDF